jgi:hypothetical protein
MTQSLNKTKKNLSLKEKQKILRKTKAKLSIKEKEIVNKDIKNANFDKVCLVLKKLLNKMSKREISHYKQLRRIAEQKKLSKTK